MMKGEEEDQKQKRGRKSVCEGGRGSGRGRNQSAVCEKRMEEGEVALHWRKQLLGRGLSFSLYLLVLEETKF